MFSASACSRASCVRFGVLPSAGDDWIEDVSEFVRRKNENRDDVEGVMGMAVPGVTVLAVIGVRRTSAAPAGEE